MSKQIQNLQTFAYKSIPDTVKKEIKKNTNRIEHDIVNEIHTELMKSYKKTMRSWITSAKIPVKIHEYLVIMNEYTKPETYERIDKMRAKQFNEKGRYYLHEDDYFDEYADTIGELDDLRKLHNQENKGLKKWHFIMIYTFQFLCYKRLKKYFDIDYDDFNFEKDFVDKIAALEESEILPHIIYKIIDNTFSYNELRY